MFFLTFSLSVVSVPSVVLISDFRLSGETRAICPWGSLLQIQRPRKREKSSSLPDEMLSISFVEWSGTPYVRNGRITAVSAASPPGFGIHCIAKPMEMDPRPQLPPAPSGRPHTSPGSNPGKSHPDMLPRPVGTPHIVERQMATHRSAAFLQNACLIFVRYPERCSGLVGDAPLERMAAPPAL